MREMRETGFLHFRGRLLVAQFLVHMLGIDWTHGQKHLARYCIDYDWCINDCNWHWVACLAMFAPNWSSRDFDPRVTSRLFDPKCIYIKKWCPELRPIKTDTPEESEHIHDWGLYCREYRGVISYRRPIVDVKAARKRVIALYTAATSAMK